MSDFSQFKAKLKINQKNISEYLEQASNPLSERAEISTLALSDYNQVVPKPRFDKDALEIVEFARVLNNLAPIRIPVPSFRLDEINGDRIYNEDGTLSLVREYDNDVIREFYPLPEPAENGVDIEKIYEINKNSGKILLIIEPIKRQGSRLKTNITFLNSEVNDKYILVQLGEDSIVNNITEFSGNGKYFKTLFRNPYDYRPVRYLEGRDDPNGNFEMIDCLFDKIGNIARIKRFTNKKEVRIQYTDDTKNITVKSRQQ